MAKLGVSSSCSPLLQGMMLLSLLLLASIQAPVMALPQLQAVAEAGGKVAAKVMNQGREAFLDHDRPEVADHGAKLALTAWGKLDPASRPFTDGAKKGIKYHKKLCKAQRLMNKLNPEDMFRSFPALFSYSVKIQGIVNVVTCWSNEQQVPAAGTGARITGILVGQEMVPVQTPAPAAYQNTAQQLAATTYYYNLERSRLARPLREAVIRQMNALNRGAILFPPTDDELCYAATAAALRLPPIAVLLASDNGGMQTMELGVATDTPVWYQKSFTYCLGIQSTIQLLTLGSP